MDEKKKEVKGMKERKRRTKSRKWPVGTLSFTCSVRERTGVVVTR